MNASTASVKTFLKFAFWYAVAAAIDYALTNIGNLNLGVLFTPILAAALKAVATWVATQKEIKELTR